MTTTTNLGSGYALVPVAPVPDWRTSAGGGPISKSSQASVPAHAGTFVQRSPLNVVREAEAGANWPVNLPDTAMFLPDGRLVRREPWADATYPGAFGAAEVFPVAIGPARKGPRPAFWTMLIGAGAGAGLVRERHIVGAIGGALVGGVLGLIFG